MNQHSIAAAWAEQGFKAMFGRLPTDNELSIMLGVALIESGYGQSWKGAGIGSNNMGAVQAGMPPCKDNQFLYKDSHPKSDGSSESYSVCFKSYPSPEAGMQDLAKQLYKMRANVLAEAGAGDLVGVSTAMYDSHYYEGHGSNREARIANHVEALRSGVLAASSGAGLAWHESSSALPSDSNSMLIAGGVVAAGVAFALWRWRKGQS